MKAQRAPTRCVLALGMGVFGCHTAGSDWMAQPLPGTHERWSTEPDPPAAPPPQEPAVTPVGPTARKGEPRRLPSAEGKVAEGEVLGTFRNTYYDFPNEAAFDGEPVDLMDASCELIKKVPVGFHDAVCVQGSGFLTTGQTVSFARRNCECARTCPRTDQKICFDPLPVARFPWGRGALGKPITPLLTVAVDETVIPMGTAIYVPELDGLPRDPEGRATHDGCFIAEDRGLKVEGRHIDVFTGERAMTEIWNRAVPSNQGVTVVLDSPRCRRTARR